MRTSGPATLAAVALIALGVSACGSSDNEPAPAAAGDRSRGEPGADPRTSRGDNGGGAAQGPELTAPPCPPDASNCAEASGQIIYVERVDPDGDGDAHFVLLSGESVTGPGISVIDVRPELRPSPLPEPGDELAASGPVFRGSYGQRQIQANAIRVGG